MTVQSVGKEGIALVISHSVAVTATSDDTQAIAEGETDTCAVAGASYGVSTRTSGRVCGSEIVTTVVTAAAHSRVSTAAAVHPIGGLSIAEQFVIIAQLVLPVRLYRPGTHRSQCVAFVAYLPAMQCVHTHEPVTGAIVPALHTSQFVLLMLCVPIGQCWQSGAPGLFANVPEGHLVHMVVLELYLPEGQA